MLCLIGALYDHAPAWVHGYDLMKQTGLLSGTLYPQLIRLSEQGLVEAEWRDAQLPGRPPRHAYRLTAHGLTYARDVLPGRATPDAAGHPA